MRFAQDGLPAVELVEPADFAAFHPVADAPDDADRLAGRSPATKGATETTKMPGMSSFSPLGPVCSVVNTSCRSPLDRRAPFFTVPPTKISSERERSISSAGLANRSLNSGSNSGAHRPKVPPVRPRAPQGRRKGLHIHGLGIAFDPLAELVRDGEGIFHPVLAPAGFAIQRVIIEHRSETGRGPRSGGENGAAVILVPVREVHEGGERCKPSPCPCAPASGAPPPEGP